MEKEKILSKLNAKDYNNELEMILEEKDFSSNIKNLLLSMLYKIEAGYIDYINVKRIVESKKDYIEQILKIIKEKCKHIKQIEENTEEGKDILQSNKSYHIEKIERTIKIVYPNEKKLLYAIYEIDDRQVYLDEKYNLIRVSLSELLNLGENINNTEVLRDFNGWSWNTVEDEILDIQTNLIYQNLIYLLGIKFIKDWVHTNEIKDYVKMVRETLEYLYEKQNAEEILDIVYRLSILISCKNNQKEKQRLLEEKKVLELELQRLENKAQLLEEVWKSKKETIKKIREIDSIQNDKKLLEEEFIKRNKKLPEYNKIFSLSHLAEILTKQRKKLILSMEEENQILEPNHYVKVKQQIKKQLELLKNIEKEDTDEQKKTELINLQKLFIKCFIINIKRAKEKDIIINHIYMYRYYEYLYIEKQKQVKDEPELQKEKLELIQNLLKRAYELKVISKVFLEEEKNLEIIENILTTKIMNLENITLELIQENQILKLNIYDIDILEKSIEIKNVDKKDLSIKPNKKTKLFI